MRFWFFTPCFGGQRLARSWFPTSPRPEVRLRVHPESGAGMDLAPAAEGFRVEHVEDGARKVGAFGIQLLGCSLGIFVKVFVKVMIG